MSLHFFQARRCFLFTCCFALAVMLIPSPAFALTETYDSTPVGTLTTSKGSSTGTYGAFTYSYRDGSGALTSDIYWIPDPYGLSGAGIGTDSSSTGLGREIDITRTSGSTFSFTSLALLNFSPNDGNCHSVSVTFTGFRSGTSIYSESVSIQSMGCGTAASHWTTFSPSSAWASIDKLSITAGSTLDPSLDNFGYSLSTSATNAASSITGTGATLNGTVNGGGESNTVTFSYGTTSSYGSTATAAQSPVSGSSNTAVSAAVTGLTCNTLYHYKVNAAASVTVSGSDTTFTTSSCVPGAPTIGTATAGNGQASVAFSAPSSAGGTSITGYTVTSSPGSITATGTASPIIVTGLTNGTAYTFTVTATSSVGTGAASAASNSVTPQATQSITFAQPADQDFGTTPTLTATAPGGTVSFTSTTPAVCTITGGVLTFLTTGSCTISADQAGGGAYQAAATVSQTFNVHAVVPGAPTGVTATVGNLQAVASFTAPSNTGGAAIDNYRVTSSGGQTVTGNSTSLTVTGLTNGTAYTYTVEAHNNIGWGPASTASSAVTPLGPQTITFAQPADQNFGTNPTLTATAPGGTVTFSSTTTSVCAITNGGVLTFLTAGSCTIKADQAGGGAYLAATTVSRTFTVNAIAPGAPTGVSSTAGDSQASVSFTALASDGGAAISSYKVTSSGGQTATGTASPIVVTGLTNGTPYTFTVQAYNSAGWGGASTASTSVTPQSSQTVSFTNPGTQSFGTALTLTATAPGGAITFSSNTTGVCAVNSTTGVIGYVSAGQCAILASQAGGAAYLAASASQSFTITAVAPAAPTIGTATAGNAQATVAFTAPSNTGGAAITGYTVTSSPSGGTDSNAGSTSLSHVITGLTNGTSYTFTVAATNSASLTGPASVASNSVTPKAAQTITFANPSIQSFGTTPTLSATATSGLTVTFSSSTTAVCTVTSGGVLTFLSAGTCSINADQAGSASYAAAATVSQTFAVNAIVPGAPTIGTAAAGNTQATVSFTAPSNTGGAAISSYTVTSSPGGFTGTGTASPITVTGLTNSTAYTFTVKATNSAGSGAASAASNSVTPVLSAPVANAASATVAYGSSANVITPTLGGGTANSLSVTQPAHGTASVSGLTLIYTPVATYSGTDTFTYTGTNAGGTSAAATVTITVNPQAPIAGAVSMKVEIGSANNVVPLVLTGGTVASVAVGTVPLHGTATASGTVITYTPAAGYSGNDSFTYTATNAGGTSPAGTVSILVQSRPDPTKDAEVIALLNAQVQMAKRFGQTQIGNFQTHLEGLHARSRALSQDGQKFASRGKAPTPAESTATSLTEFSSGTNTATVGSSPSALFSPRSSKLGTDVRCQAGNTESCMATGGIRPAGDGIDSLVLGTLTSAGKHSDWWPWPTLSVNGSSKDLLGSGMNVWSAGTINVGKQSENDTRFTTSGISVGGDNHVTDKLILGVGAGFGHERQKIGSNDTKNRGDGYSIVAYGSYQPEEGFFIDGLIGYGHLAFDAERYVTATGDFAQSDRKGSQWFSSLSGGYEYVDGKFLFSPYGRLDLIHTRLDETAESGAGTSNLTYQAQTSRSTKLSLGLRSETAFEIDKGTIKPSLRVEYQHDFAEPGVANMVYSDDANGTVYQLDMENTDRNTMVLGLGLDFALRKSWQTGLSYKFSHGSSSSSQMQSFGVYVKRAF